MKDIDWILNEDIGVIKVGGTYLVTERTSRNRCCIISFANDRMLFDGEDIETEDFMAYVGLLDMVDESAPGTPVLFDKDL